MSTVGRTVTWETRSCRRTGTVVAHVAAGRSLVSAFYVEGRTGEHVAGDDVVDVDRYLVRTAEGGRRRWFAPSACAVKFAADAAGSTR